MVPCRTRSGQSGTRWSLPGGVARPRSALHLGLRQVWSALSFAMIDFATRTPNLPYGHGGCRRASCYSKRRDRAKVAAQAPQGRLSPPYSRRRLGRIRESNLLRVPLLRSSLRVPVRERNIIQYLILPHIGGEDNNRLRQVLPQILERVRPRVFRRSELDLRSDPGSRGRFEVDRLPGAVGDQTVGEFPTR